MLNTNKNPDFFLFYDWLKRIVIIIIVIVLL